MKEKIIKISMLLLVMLLCLWLVTDQYSKLKKPYKREWEEPPFGETKKDAVELTGRVNAILPVSFIVTTFPSY